MQTDANNYSTNLHIENIILLGTMVGPVGQI